MTDPRYPKLAKLLVTYSTRVQPGDRVLLDLTDVPDEMAIELMRALPPELQRTDVVVRVVKQTLESAHIGVAGIIADAFNLEVSILTICTISWLLCFVFYLGAMFTIKKDVHSLRTQMEERAGIERAKHAPAA